MASKYGLNAFTVQEATNAKAYYTYKYEDITINSTDITSPDESADWSTNPAKEITLTKKSGDDANTVSLKLKIDGSYGDTIQFLLSDFPLTIDGLLIQQIAFSTSDTATDEILRLLSFH
tara:strand:- start:3141 stop:3497 length:357 start_codon:yes stop_codon:yes gene_type:complete